MYDIRIVREDRVGGLLKVGGRYIEMDKMIIG